MTRPAIERETGADPVEAPGVPGFRTWRGVYGFVLAALVGIVVLLAVLTRCFAG